MPRPVGAAEGRRALGRVCEGLLPEGRRRRERVSERVVKVGREREGVAERQHAAQEERRERAAWPEGRRGSGDVHHVRERIKSLLVKTKDRAGQQTERPATKHKQ